LDIVLRQVAGIGQLQDHFIGIGLVLVIVVVAAGGERSDAKKARNEHGDKRFEFHFLVL